VTHELLSTEAEFGHFLVFVTDDEREMLARLTIAAHKDDVAADYDREKLVAQVAAEQHYGRSMLHPGAFRTEYFDNREALDARLAATSSFTSPNNFK